MNPEQLFNDIAQFVADGRALLKAGAMMELSGLDTRVLELNESVLKLSGAERQRYAERLQALLDEVRLLGEEMAVYHEALAEGMRNLSSHQKANIAYRTAAADAPKKKKPSE